MTKEPSSTRSNFLSLFHWKYVSTWPWLIVTVFSATLHLILFGVTAHLYRFHIMLWKNGMTTYSYIVNIRRNPNSRDTVTEIPNHRIPHGRAIYDSSIVNNAITSPYNNNNNNNNNNNSATSRPITPPRRLPEIQRPSTTGNRPRPPPFGHIPRTLTNSSHPSKPSSANAERTANPV
uniref:Uncharacterized protein n=1 Tax=Panagrolaimus davidi TaxID=227884 RepID=A0A914PGA3_9BILA